MAQETLKGSVLGGDREVPETTHFSDIEQAEIARVNGITKPAFIKALACLSIKQRQKIALTLRTAFDTVLEGVSVQVNGVLPQENAIMVMNHPTHSNHHRILPSWSPVNYAPPHYIMLLDALMRTEAGDSDFALVTRATKPVNGMIEALDYITVDSDTPDVDRINTDVVKAIDTGKVVAVCPEGRFYGKRESNQRKLMGPLKGGFYHFAREADVPVVPVELEGFNRAGSTQFTINVGDQLRVEDFTSSGEMAQYVKEKIFCERFGFSSVDT